MQFRLLWLIDYKQLKCILLCLIEEKQLKYPLLCLREETCSTENATKIALKEPKFIVPFFAMLYLYLSWDIVLSSYTQP